MKMIALGYHDQSAPRHWNLQRMYEGQGIRVLECHTEARGLFGKWRDLARKYRSMEAQADSVLVTFPGHTLMPIAWWLTRKPRKKLIFDAFLSLWDTLVDDRKKYTRWGPMAAMLFFLDWIALHLADKVLIDTQEHRKFLIRRFRLDPDRILAIPLGTRTDLFKPGTRRPYREGTFKILFYGTYIPLQGIEHILDAAAILQESHPQMHFTLVGSGQTYPAMRRRAAALHLANVTFRNRMPYEELPMLIHESHLCLGIFGTSGKAHRVIPHKVYDAVACGVPVVTADTPAMHELLKEEGGLPRTTPQNGVGARVILCKAGDPKDIAEKLAALIKK